MNKLYDFIDTDDCSDCRNKIEHLHLVYDFKYKELSYYHSYEKSTIQNKKKVILKPSVYICINNKTKEILELTEQEYKQTIESKNGKRKKSI